MYQRPSCFMTRIHIERCSIGAYGRGEQLPRKGPRDVVPTNKCGRLRCGVSLVVTGAAVAPRPSAGL